MTIMEQFDRDVAPISEFLVNLYNRWQHEKEYEDFKEYQECVKKNLPDTMEFLDMRKRPMVLTIRYRKEWQVFLTIKRTEISWKGRKLE